MPDKNENTQVVRRSVSLTPEADAKLTRLMQGTGMDRSTAVNLLIMRANIDLILFEPEEREDAP